MGHESKVFCAFCKTARHVRLIKHVRWSESLGLALLCLASMLFFPVHWWPRFLFVYILLLGLLEAVFQVRWRLSVVCPECGFDPVVYKRDTAAACERVKRHLAHRRKRPLSALSEPLNLPAKIQKAPDSDAKPKLVSRRI